MNIELDSFETRLLTELREYVGDSTAAARGDAGRPQRSGRARFALVAAIGVVAAAVVVAAALLVPGLGSKPAFSVGGGNAGEVRVEINRPEDAAGLERALASHGVVADITYLSELQVCAPGRYTVVDRSSGMKVSIGERQISLTLPPDTVRTGETLVLAWSVVPLTGAEIAELDRAEQDTEVVSSGGFQASVKLEVATGPVAPCRPVAAPIGG